MFNNNGLPTLYKIVQLKGDMLILQHVCPMSRMISTSEFKFDHKNNRWDYISEVLLKK